MSHLSHVEFVDAVERRLSGLRLEHAEQCAECRAEIDRLRATMDLAGADAGDEPSPLFWTHFSARVSEAIRSEPIEPATSWRTWLLRPAALTLATALVAVVGLSLVSERAKRTGSTPSPAAEPPRMAAVASSVDSGPLETGDDLDADSAWAVVRTAAEGIDWDDARAAGLEAQPGTADRMALELTDAERIELMRILEQEMKRSGA